MNDFVTYSQALKLKKLGFDLKCLAKYTKVRSCNMNNLSITEISWDFETGRLNYGSTKDYNTDWYSKQGYTSAPTLEQAFRWLVNKSKLWNTEWIVHFGADSFRLVRFKNDQIDTTLDTEKSIDKLIKLAQNEIKSQT